MKGWVGAPILPSILPVISVLCLTTEQVKLSLVHLYARHLL